MTINTDDIDAIASKMCLYQTNRFNAAIGMPTIAAEDWGECWPKLVGEVGELFRGMVWLVIGELGRIETSKGD